METERKRRSTTARPIFPFLLLLILLFSTQSALANPTFIVFGPAVSVMELAHFLAYPWLSLVLLGLLFVEALVVFRSAPEGVLRQRAFILLWTAINVVTYFFLFLPLWQFTSWTESAPLETDWIAFLRGTAATEAVVVLVESWILSVLTSLSFVAKRKIEFVEALRPVLLGNVASWALSLLIVKLLDELYW